MFTHSSPCTSSSTMPRLGAQQGLTPPWERNVSYCTEPCSLEGSGQPDLTGKCCRQRCQALLFLSSWRMPGTAAVTWRQHGGRTHRQQIHKHSEDLIAAISLLMERQAKFSSDNSSWFNCDKLISASLLLEMELCPFQGGFLH